MSGWKDWAIGEVVTESDFQAFVQDQVVQVYDDSTDRDNTLGTAVAEGMVAYLKDTDATQVYNGTAWVNVGEAGDITAVTAGTALTGGGTAGDVTLDVDISALATAHAGNALNANGELLDVDESAITVAQSQVTDLVSDLADKADNADFTGGTAGYTALSNGTAGLSYQPVSHNYIINGAFDIWQRGTSFPSASSNDYTADRWQYTQGAASGATISQVAFSPGDVEAIGFGDAEYFLRFDVASAGNANTMVRQRIEDVRTLAGQTVTLSFWAKADAAFDLQTRITQNFSGSSNVDYVLDRASVTTSWQRFQISTTLSGISGKTIGSGNSLDVRFTDIDGDAPTLDLWGVQLEAGSIATPFKRNANSIQGELAACERYYQVLADGTSANTFIAMGLYRGTSVLEVPFQLRTAMRNRTDLTLEATDSADIYKALQGTSTDTFDSLDLGSPSSEFSVMLTNSTEVSGTVGESARVTVNGGKVALVCEL